ncbi:P-loop containing nucleoside triphosphate hydrolase protein [Suillus cothurnatus]|nr:P-loop containing nucleoside triphosphate hydrolase protein [Suillus cothurnatus]
MLDLMTMGKRKILVYMEFPMMAPLLVSVLQLYNIVPLIIHGGHGIEERNETVQKFSTDPAARMLISSNVGAIGLNLTAASITILSDQCWSRMLVNQIIGVLVYNMVALGTVDVLMVDHGEGKGNMLGQFLSANKGVFTTIKNVAAGRLPVANADDDDEVEIIDTPVPAAGSSKSQKKVTTGSKTRIACNVVQMGDNDGKFLDINNNNSVVLDEVREQQANEEKAAATRKGKDKAKPQANASVMDKIELSDVRGHILWKFTDVICQVVQALGGASAARTVSQGTSAATGANIMLRGIAAQLAGGWFGNTLITLSSIDWLDGVMVALAIYTLNFFRPDIWLNKTDPTSQASQQEADEEEAAT